MGVGLKFVFRAQDFVETAECEGCRQVTTCSQSSQVLILKELPTAEKNMQAQVHS